VTYCNESGVWAKAVIICFGVPILEFECGELVLQYRELVHLFI